MAIGMTAQSMEAVRCGPVWSAVDSIRRLAEGDHEALAELYDRYAGLVNGLALRILHDTSDAEDVVQAVFIQVWRQADRYSVKRGAPEAWLRTLTRTRALDRLRQRVSRRENISPHGPRGVTRPVVVERLAVRQAFTALSPVQRETLELAYYEGLSQLEIAERLGEPLGTIKTRTRTGLMRLRQVLRRQPLPDQAPAPRSQATAPALAPVDWR